MTRADLSTARAFKLDVAESPIEGHGGLRRLKRDQSYYQETKR